MGDELAIDFGACATLSLAETARVLGIHRSTAWELHKRGEFPPPVMRIGSRLRVAKHHLAEYVRSGGGTVSQASTADVDEGD